MSGSHRTADDRGIPHENNTSATRPRVTPLTEEQIETMTGYFSERDVQYDKTPSRLFVENVLSKVSAVGSPS